MGGSRCELFGKAINMLLVTGWEGDEGGGCRGLIGPR